MASPMLPSAHVELTWGVLNLAQRAGLWRDADYRGVALAAIVPDLIDKPLAVFALSQENATLLFSHTLMAHLLLWVSVLAAGRRYAPYALAASSHLVGDRMWSFLQTFLWPFRGRRFHQWRHVGSPAAFLAAYREIVRSESKLVAFELLGFASLAWLVLDRKLYCKESLWRFLTTGRVTR
jgi:hypothetical protein